MGEYAMFQGESIKIGTCESMYYLRADQAAMVQPEPGNVDPIRDREGLLFRFPFPDEDNVLPGAFREHDRGVTVSVPGWDYSEITHHRVHVRSDSGLYASLRCPYATPEPGVDCPFHNVPTFPRVRITQQKWVPGCGLVLVCDCPHCGAAYRIESADEVAPVVQALRDKGDTFHATIADRIVKGYTLRLFVPAGVC